ncbi:MAG: hypothetical protein ACTSPD_02730 [Promethearchaeota archaeon]
MSQLNYDSIIAQLKSELNTECAIANKYGIVLASLIKEFAKNKIIPQKILELILSRQEIADELNLNQINSFALEAQENNYLFTFSEELILISKLNLSVNLAKFMPSIRIFTQKLSESSKEDDIQEFSLFDFSKETNKIEKTLQEESVNKDKYSIIKELIKYISR